MKRYLTPEQFEGVQRRFDAGQASITISRRVSRQFFTRVPNASIVATTGKSFASKKAVIWTGVFTPLVMLVVCIATVIYYFGWFATLGAPIVGVFWTVIAGLTGDKGDWRHGLAGLLAGLALTLILEQAYAVPLILFTVSLWIHRVTYQVAQIWLTELVKNSFGAYDMLVEHIDLTDAALQEQTEPVRA